MALGQVFHDAGDDGLRENDTHVFEGLLRVLAAHGVADLLVVFLFFRGQLPDAARIQGRAVKALPQTVQLSLVLLRIDVADGLAHLRKDVGQVVGLVVLDGSGQPLAQIRQFLILLVHVFQIHVVVSFLGIQKGVSSLDTPLRFGQSFENKLNRLFWGGAGGSWGGFLGAGEGTASV